MTTIPPAPCMESGSNIRFVNGGENACIERKDPDRRRFVASDRGLACSPGSHPEMYPQILCSGGAEESGSGYNPGDPENALRGCNPLRAFSGGFRDSGRKESLSSTSSNYVEVFRRRAPPGLYPGGLPIPGVAPRCGNQGERECSRHSTECRCSTLTCG